jgi:hypothetical protein
LNNAPITISSIITLLAVVIVGVVLVAPTELPPSTKDISNPVVGKTSIKVHAFAVVEAPNVTVIVVLVVIRPPSIGVVAIKP